MFKAKEIPTAAEQKRRDAEAKKFMVKNPAYRASDESAARLMELLEKKGLEFNAEDLQTVFDEQQIIEKLLQQKESFDFLLEHLSDEQPFAATAANAKLLAATMTKNKWPWRREYLNKALEELKESKAAIQYGIPEQVVIEEPKEEAPIVEVETFPWGGRIGDGQNGTVDINSLSGTQMRDYLGDYKYGKEFKKQLEAASIYYQMKKNKF
jgi:hypothetical protein